MSVRFQSDMIRRQVKTILEPTSMHESVLPFEILLVEDNPGDVYLIQEAFREGRFPFHLSVAEDAEQATGFLKREGPYQKAPRPDLILLDLNLPKKDGRQLLSEIKTDPLLRQVPVIVLTSSDASTDVRRAYRLHANCYLTKPAQMDSFVGMIRSLEEFWLNTVRLPNHGYRQRLPN
jgi:two-component system, chemotaxis family, response regulator Rcp1